VFESELDVGVHEVRVGKTAMHVVGARVNEVWLKKSDCCFVSAINTSRERESVCVCVCQRECAEAHREIRRG
jgi:hypothetical protein